MKRIFSFIFILMLLVTSSCNKSEINPEKFQLKTKPVALETIKDIVNRLKERGAFKNRKVSIFNNQTPQLLSTQKPVLFDDEPVSTLLTEEEISIIINPLVVNGAQLQAELVAYVSNTSEWNDLTVTDQYEILNMTNGQLADLAVTYAAATQAASLSSTIKDCVSFALGIAGIQHLVSSLATGATVTTTIGILKWIGKRYLSYIGIAWMIWDFTDCITGF